VNQADRVEGALGATETTETSLGSITVPTAGVKRIVGVYGTATIATTTAEQASGYFRLAFKTLAGVFKFPLTINQGPAGTLASPGWSSNHSIIPVDIPVPANETITGYATLDVAQTGACRAAVGVIYE